LQGFVYVDRYLCRQSREVLYRIEIKRTVTTVVPSDI